MTTPDLTTPDFTTPTVPGYKIITLPQSPRTPVDFDAPEVNLEPVGLDIKDPLSFEGFEISVHQGCLPLEHYVSIGNSGLVTIDSRGGRYSDSANRAQTFRDQYEGTKFQGRIYPTAWEYYLGEADF